MKKVTFSLLTFLLATGCAWPAAANHSPPCMKRADLIQQLHERDGEQQSALGLSGRGTAIEVWQTPPDALQPTFTIVETNSARMSCIRMTGTNWEIAPGRPLEHKIGTQP